MKLNDVSTSDEVEDVRNASDQILLRRGVEEKSAGRVAELLQVVVL